MMMKPTNNDSDDEHNTNNHTTNWLGFSLLSPHTHTDTNTNSRSNHHMKFTSSSSSTTTSDVVPQQQHSQTQLTSGMNVPIGIDLHSLPTQLGFGGGVFGAGGGENVAGVCGPYSSPLSVMPLNSDGSLCLMEALNRSQAQAATGTDSSAQRLVQAHQYPPFSYNPAYGNLHYLAEDKSSLALSGSRQFCPAISYGNLQSLSLSMSTSPQSSCIPTLQHMTNSSPTTAPVECFGIETKKRGHENADGNGHINGNQKQVVHRKSIDTFGQRTSQYRGVTRHRWTGRYEAHLWDNSCKKEGQSRKGRQVYLGGYDMEEKAARSYDLAALKYWGPSTHINFPLENYHQELGEMKNMSRQEYVAHLRRTWQKEQRIFQRCFDVQRCYKVMISRVYRHHQHGRWQARIGRVAGNKDLYLGTFSTQEEAAEAYDIAAIKFRGTNAVTNFDITRYDVERIMASNTLLSGDMARRNNRDSGICNGAFNQETSISEGLGDIVRLERSSHDVWAKELQQFGIGYDPTRSVSENNTVSNGDTEAAAAVDMGKFGIHLSNSPSMVTSVSSSREVSPAERSVAMTPFGIAPPNNGLSKLSYGSGTSNSSSSWIPTLQIRPDMAVPHMPVFASWTDL